MSKQTIVILTSPCSNIEDARKLMSDVTGGSEVTWHIDNKYYETDVDFHIYNDDDKYIGKLGVEAVILLTNSTEDSLANLATQMELIDKWSPQVRLMVCEKCSEDDNGDKRCLNRGSVLQWCLENEMELIEMKPDSEECELGDYGIERIVSALQSHTWPNLMLKTSKKQLKSKESSQTAGVSKPAPTTTQKSSEDAKEAVDDDDDDDERYGQNIQTLMSQMASLKTECLSKGSKEDQVKYAENIAKAFWEVLGGDDGEFDSD